MNDFYFISPSYSYLKSINVFPYLSLKIKESRLPLSTQKDNGEGSPYLNSLKLKAFLQISLTNTISLIVEI